VTTPVDTLTALLDAAAKQFGISMGRRMVIWHREHADPGYSHNPEMLLETKIRSEADLVSSQIDNGLHAPAIDIDLPCRLIPSATHDHYHLYIDKEMTWEEYEKLLTVMCEVGIVDANYLDMARERKATYVRLPEKPKTEREALVDRNAALRRRSAAKAAEKATAKPAEKATPWWRKSSPKTPKTRRNTIGTG
jgi:hypothetical protein